MSQDLNSTVFLISSSKWGTTYIIFGISINTNCHWLLISMKIMFQQNEIANCKVFCPLFSHFFFSWTLKKFLLPSAPKLTNNMLYTLQSPFWIYVLFARGMTIFIFIGVPRWKWHFHFQVMIVSTVAGLKLMISSTSVDTL